MVELDLGFDVIWVVWNAFYRADDLALGFVVMTDAFGTKVGVDDVNFSPHRNRIVWAFGFAHIAVDAVVGDNQCHNVPMKKQSE